MSEQNENLEALAEDDESAVEDELGDAAKTSGSGGGSGILDPIP